MAQQVDLGEGAAAQDAERLVVRVERAGRVGERRGGAEREAGAAGAAGAARLRDIATEAVPASCTPSAGVDP